MKEITLKVQVGPKGTVPVTRTLKVYYDNDYARDRLVADAMRSATAWAQQRLALPFTGRH